ncbi:hypothetical protein M885DRAFT_321321 [Pelagophyceae sp. CCMP2097]|nr:hypothetical protein M885DRAFT_321321 [Pelagophyceae sp. CCMP2097]
MRGWPTPGRRRKRACSATPLRGLGRGGATRPSELLVPKVEKGLCGRVHISREFPQNRAKFGLGQKEPRRGKLSRRQFDLRSRKKKKTLEPQKSLKSSARRRIGTFAGAFRGDPGPPSRHGSVQDIQKAVYKSFKKSRPRARHGARDEGPSYVP